MLSDFLIICYALLPVVMYSVIIFFSTPKKTVDLNHWLKYFWGGILAAITCFYFYKIFPAWSYLFMEKDPLSAIFWNCFITVALIEEACKYIAFRLLQFKQNVIATTFGYCAVGGGFALTENLAYGFSFGEPVLISRAFSAIVVHMALGLFAGYIISLGNLKVKDEPNTELDLVLQTPKKRKTFYNALALVVVIFVHGLYDFNLLYQTEYTLLFHYIIMLGVLLGARYAFKNIVNAYFRELSRELQ